MPQSKQPISIVIPTLNEAGNIELLFERIDKALRSSKIPYEIIVIDDHSSDGTAELALKADPKYNVRLEFKQGKSGKAFSLLQGFKAVKYDLICMIDGDLQYPPEAIPAMYHKMEYCSADIVLTRRLKPKTNPLRQLMSRTYNYFFAYILFGINYDTQSGEKMFKKTVIENISLSPSPWSFDLEFIIRSLERNYKIVEHEILFGQRFAGVPKVKILNATSEMIRASLRLRRQTALKQVKFSYNRNLAFAKQVLGVVAVTAIAATLAVSFSGGKTSADPLTNTVGSLVNQVSATPQPASTTSSTATTSSSSPASSAAAAPTSVTNSSSTPTATVELASAQTTKSDKTATPSTSTSAGTAPSITTLASPATSTDQSKPVDYYTSTKLSHNRTQEFLNVARWMLEIGGSLIIIGILIVMERRLTHLKSGRPNLYNS